MLKSGENNNSSIEQEHNCSQYFLNLINQQFNAIKSFDGCKSDVIVRPNHIVKIYGLEFRLKAHVIKLLRINTISN